MTNHQKRFQGQSVEEGGAPVFIDTGITEILTINPINKIKELINAYQQL